MNKDFALEAHRVTKPIQLLAAWLIGLAVVDSSFLAAATQIEQPQWLRCLLVIAAIFNVPLFLGASFLLQTKYRPQMLEDRYYAAHLATMTNQAPPSTDIGDQLDARMLHLEERILRRLLTPSSKRQKFAGDQEQLPFTADHQIHSAHWSTCKAQINDLIPQASGIQEELTSLGVAIASSFGSTSEVPAPPGSVVLAFTAGFNGIELADLLARLRVYGVTGVQYSELAVPRMMFVGAYGYFHGHPVAKISDALINELRTASGDASLVIDIVMRNAHPLIEDLGAALDSLPQMERDVLKLHLSTSGGKFQTISAISSSLGVTWASARKAAFNGFLALDNHVRQRNMMMSNRDDR